MNSQTSKEAVTTEPIRRQQIDIWLYFNHANENQKSLEFNERLRCQNASASLFKCWCTVYPSQMQDNCGDVKLTIQLSTANVHNTANMPAPVILWQMINMMPGSASTTFTHKSVAPLTKILYRGDTMKDLSFKRKGKGGEIEKMIPEV